MGVLTFWEMLLFFTFVYVVIWPEDVGELIGKIWVGCARILHKEEEKIERERLQKPTSERRG